MVDHGLTSDKLAKFEYFDRHDLVGSAVASGEYDAGALKESTYARLKIEGLALREIARIKNVTKPWVARSGLDAKTAIAIREALIAIRNPAVLKTLSGFVPVAPSEYDVICEAMDRAVRSF